ncbi:MAG: NAD-dependent epimerase/dehydratase family protein [Bacteroidota bacterium]
MIKYSTKIDDEVFNKIKLLEGPIFIFGASGFIGANMLEAISQVRSDYYAVTHGAQIAWRLKLLNLPSTNVLNCDITSKVSVEKIFNEYNPKTIFNLASYGGYSKHSDTNLIYETNVIGNLNILEACKEQNIKCYIHAGSSSEYGLNCASPEESSEMKPNSHYALSKVTCAYQIKYYADFFNVPALNFRLYSIYGPWEEPDRLMPVVIQRARKGELPPFVSPDISRDFLYVSDCIEAFLDASINIKKEMYGESFNIASGNKTTIENLAQTVINVFEVKQAPIYKSYEKRKWDLVDWFGNNNKAKEYFNWRPKINIIDGLKYTSEWQDKNEYETNVLPFFENRGINRKLTCIIACYKDEQAIPIMYERLVKMFNEMKIRYEIIFVNDCSPDNSEQIIENLCAIDNNVVCISHSRNFGSQSAFLSGMEIATGDGIVLMDGDLQDPPEIIPQFYNKWIEGYDVIYGVRVKREMPFIMDKIYKLFYRIFKSVSYIKIPVDAGDFSLIDKKVANEIVKLPETEVFLRGLRAWVGFKQTGVEYVRPERMFGVSTNNWRKNINWAKKAIFSFSFLPIEFMSYLGFFLTVLSFLALIAQIVMKWVYPDLPHGVPSIIVLILFFGGVQLLSLSLIGEYVSKIFEETKNRPRFIRTKIIKNNKKALI